MPPPNSTRSSSLPLAAAPMSNPAPPHRRLPTPSPPSPPSSTATSPASSPASPPRAPRSLRFTRRGPREPPSPSRARALTGTPVFTVCNSSNEFLLVSDPATGLRSLGFRSEDAYALLSHVRTRQPVLGKGAKVVPITLDQVYMLKAEGIAFRFLPDPLQIKNALEEDIERELTRASKASSGSALSKQIMAGSLEDILKKLEVGWR